jgi:hypothetical protein
LIASTCAEARPPVESSAARATMRGGDAGSGVGTARDGEGKVAASDEAGPATEGAESFVSGNVAGAMRAAVAVAVLDTVEAG